MPGWKLRFPTAIATILTFAAAAILIPQAQAALAVTSTREPVSSFSTRDRSPSNGIEQNRLNQPLLVAQRQGRKALVIGNAAYEEDALANPVNDANDIAEALRSLGFEVTLRTNLDLRAMDEAIDAFNRQLRPGEVGLFYYAGHGVQVSGENYLVPLRAKLARQADVKYDAVPLGKILNAMEASETQVNILIIDACRDNPFYRRWRPVRGKDLTRGLAPIELPPKGTIIAFSTSPGNVAEDGEGQRNSPYTFHLLRYINTPNLDVGIMFRRVRAAVLQETNGEQDPLHQVSLVSEFALNPTQPPSTPTPSIEAPVTVSAEPAPASAPVLPVPAPAAQEPVASAPDFTRPSSPGGVAVELGSDSIEPPSPTPAPTASAPAAVATTPTPRFNSSRSLISATTGVNYQKLNALLAAQRWKEADAETIETMLQAMVSKEGLSLAPPTDTDINTFACEDLRLIDGLWSHHSKGHFGFSIQKDIYVSLGGKLNGEYNVTTWNKFANRVEWRKGIGYLSKDNLTFALTGPRGHLPAVDLHFLFLNGIERIAPNLFARAKLCGL